MFKAEFETMLIVPVYFEDKIQAKMTLAGYIGANEFYARPLIKSGFGNEVSEIRRTFAKAGLLEAANKVSEKLLEEIAISADSCKEQLEHIAKTRLKTVILGFDLPKEKYTDDFFEKLDKLLTGLKQDAS
jgi:hypothetical protein